MSAEVTVHSAQFVDGVLHTVMLNHEGRRCRAIVMDAHRPPAPDESGTGFVRLRTDAYHADDDEECDYNHCEDPPVWLVTYRLTSGWRVRSGFCVLHERMGRE